ncbi:MAG: dihydroorotate dehydrogenase electron transfer subunit [Candidatus Omnitrophica bacterium]|nr:dihydroorotate dehydrogenase electron transfer subunit [Candidatus Omnitrophota bacterium]
MNPIFQLDAKVIEQAKVAEESFILSLEAPSIAKTIQPGQFVQIRCIPRYDPLLPRPFSIYRVREKRILDILYEVVGRGTRMLSETRKGDVVNLFGPLGVTFSYPRPKHLSILVGGGVGLAPFYDLAEALIDPKRGKQRKEDVIILLGARNKNRVFCEKDFRRLGVHFEVATDDGSYGFKGLVTELLAKHLRATRDERRTTQLYACGPRLMLRKVSELSKKFKIPCELSIDAHMPCGYGICFGCAVKVQTKDQRPKTQDPQGKGSENHFFYKLACVDGPVFDAKEIVWD